GVTKHLAAFLSAHGKSNEPVRPTHVLFNGGVFKAGAFRNRLLEALGRWSGGSTAPKSLEGEHDLDHAVARGAAYYGWAKHHGGVRIRGGTAPSYFVRLAAAGRRRPRRAPLS